ncbi:MAG: D-xylose transport system substrate-binding protein [Actinomycetota bacterium]|nr:D-xylose transport system substrate-binding protein [Actinomycetota bacterium]
MIRSLLKNRRGPSAAALVLAVVGVAAGAGLSACGTESTAPVSSGPTARVAFFLPHPKADRYEAIDLPHFSERLNELCPRCVVDYYNGEQDQEKQNAQFREALSKGAQVMVFDPVDSKKGASLIDEAKAKNVPVISYDRILWGKPFDYLVSFDHLEVGRQQGTSLKEAMGNAASGGSVIWINGPVTDSNAVLLSKGAKEVLGGSVKIVAEYTMPGPKWDTGVEAWLAKTVPTLASSTIAGVYCPSDVCAGMVGKALKAAGAKKLPPMTGSNADVAGLQRILDGEQYMTAYKPVPAEARLAAELAFNLVTGKRPKATSTLDNGAGTMPAFFVDTHVVTKDKIKETVLKDGFLTVNTLCAAAYTQACKTAGITE